VLLLSVVLTAVAPGCGNSAPTPPPVADARPPVPQAGWVVDTAHVLTDSERQRLSTMLADYHQETHHQIVVLTIPTLSGESIESYSMRVVEAWRPGYKGVNNGILVTLALKEHRVRIELGTGMEHYISDVRAKHIIDETMSPAFANREFFRGLEAGLQQLMGDARAFIVTPEDLHGS
jgi:uncharacterized protein